MDTGDTLVGARGYRERGMNEPCELRLKPSSRMDTVGDINP